MTGRRARVQRSGRKNELLTLHETATLSACWDRVPTNFYQAHALHASGICSAWKRKIRTTARPLAKWSLTAMYLVCGNVQHCLAVICRKQQVSVHAILKLGMPGVGAHVPEAHHLD